MLTKRYPKAAKKYTGGLQRGAGAENKKRKDRTKPTKTIPQKHYPLYFIYIPTCTKNPAKI